MHILVQFFQADFNNQQQYLCYNFTKFNHEVFNEEFDLSLKLMLLVIYFQYTKILHLWNQGNSHLMLPLICLIYDVWMHITLLTDLHRNNIRLVCLRLILLIIHMIIFQMKHIFLGIYGSLVVLFMGSILLVWDERNI